MGINPRQFATLVMVAVLTAGCAVRHCVEMGPAPCGGTKAGKHHPAAEECGSKYTRTQTETVGAKLPDGSVVNTKKLEVEGDLEFGLMGDKELREPSGSLMRLPSPHGAPQWERSPHYGQR